MDRYRNQEVALDFVGRGKENTAHGLCDGKCLDRVQENEKKRTQKKGRKNSPAPKITVEDAPKEQLFGHRSDKTADYKQLQDFGRIGGQGYADQLQGVDSPEGNDQADPCNNKPETGRPDKSFQKASRGRGC